MNASRFVGLVRYLTLLGILFFCGALIAHADCIQWVQRSGVGSPGPRTSPTLAFDSVHGVTVMFGGETTNGLGGRINPTDTWEYDGTNWHQITITGSSPPGRSYQAMAFDSAHGVTMLCGGQNSGGILKDTWFYASHGDGTGTWTQGPDFDTVGRSGLAMAFDSKRGVMVVMGGMSDLNTSGDDPFGTLQPTTFEWNGTSWSAGSPFHDVIRTDLGGIARHAMCFDASQGWVITGGGLVPAYSPAPSPPCNGPFYEMPFNAVNGYGTGLVGWQEIDGFEGTACGGFSQSAIAYDSRRRMSVLFGGTSLTGNVPATMEYPTLDPVSPGFNNNQWNILSLSVQPPGRSRLGLAYDSRRGVTVLYGGENANGSGPMSDTWELVGNTPAITVPSGNQQVCQGGSVTFSANVSGGSGSFLYQWQLNGVNVTNNTRISGATNTALT
ncbi:MAG TPA: immunoglobulin domain-containing protein, partial [Verrucomicrobiae bacterium]|nr:immunoglobulin domain-containing protein [Verrucomicrobiae bacterium]